MRGPTVYSKCLQFPKSSRNAKKNFDKMSGIFKNCTNSIDQL